MYIKELLVRNFRNFRAAKLQFTDSSVNTVLGENASGKTNIFHAIRLVLDDSLPQNSKYLSVNDFHRGLGIPNGHWIIIGFKFGGLGVSDEEMVMANHALELEGGNAEGTYTFVYRPKLHVRKKLFEISQSESNIETRLELISNYLHTIIIGKEDYEVVAFTRTSVDWSDDSIYSTLVGNFQTGIFPDPENEDAALIGALKPAYFSLVKEVSCTYVKALRNVVNDMKYAKTNPLYKLLSYKSSEIDGTDEIIDSVKQLNSDISGLEQIKELSQSIRNTLMEAIGQTYSPSIDISSDLPENIVDLVQSLTLVVEDSIGYNGSGKIEDLSLGGANLIYLALKLYEYEVHQEREDKIAHFLLIEEPEAHIHNHIQKTLFSNFHSTNTQVFISTHSTQISSVAKISALNMISRKANYSEVYWPANRLSQIQIIGIERYLDAIRSTLLFAKSVILVEGDAEQILIPQLIKKILGVSLDEMGISLISMDGTVFKHISVLFHQDRVKNYCSIITDRDAPYLTEPTDYADEEYIEKLQRAEVDGARRYEELSSLCGESTYLGAFFAQNTFETELILASNSALFRSAIPQLYTSPAWVTRMNTNFVTSSSAQLSHYALKLANKEGKGWFAIVLSEFINGQTNIPNYILNALSHSLEGHDKEPIYRKMMQHRLEVHSVNSQNFFNEVDNNWRRSKEAFTDLYLGDPLIPLLTAE